MLLAFAPAGPEFRVNTYTNSHQVGPAVAMDADGDFVVTWSSYLQDGSEFGVYAQRYNAAGQRFGGEFRVNATTAGRQGAGSVAMDASGGFVVAWTQTNPFPGEADVYARRYSPTGQLGTEFRVNTTTEGDQVSPVVAVDADGDFVVVWNAQDPEDDIYAQRYNSQGQPVGTEFLVNSGTVGSQHAPAVAMNARGDFVVAWQSTTFHDGEWPIAIHARRFDAAGEPVGDEFVVESPTSESVGGPSVGIDAAGEVVVAWHVGVGAIAQRFDVNREEIGPRLRLGTTQFSWSPNLAMCGDGGFVVAWLGGGNTSDVYVQRFNRESEPLRDATIANTERSDNQAPAGVAADADGDFVVVWGDQQGSGEVKAQRYTRAPAPPPLGPLGPEFRVNTTTSGNQLDASVALDRDGGFVVAWHTADGNGKAEDVFAQRYGAAGQPVGGEFRVNTTTAGSQGEPSVAMSARGGFVIAWQSVGSDLDHTGVYGRLYSAAGQPLGDEFRVNSALAFNESDPCAAMGDGGEFVIAWNGMDGSGRGILARTYSAAGQPLTDEFVVNTHTAGNQSNCSVATYDKGDFVAAWESDSQDGIYSVYINGGGGDFRVNTTVSGTHVVPSVARDAGGGFVVAWQSTNQEPGWGVYAQRFRPDRTPLGNEFRVNSYTAEDQFVASVGIDAIGDKFVVVWASRDQDGSGKGIYGQLYTGAGDTIGDEFLISNTTAGDQFLPSVAMDADGDFVVAWQSNYQDGDGYGIYARRYGVAAPSSRTRVTQVYVNGPGLTGGTAGADTAAFRIAAGIDSTLGYPIPSGADQARPFGWVGGVERISIRFDRDVAGEVDPADLSVRGVATQTYAPSGFSYDPPTRTATWTLPSGVTADRLRLFMDDAAIGGLDGEWAGGPAQSYPSGDGSPGGDFEFVFGVLAGDATRDGTVNALDLSYIKQRLNRTATNPGSAGALYSVFADVNADGVINALDLAAVRQRLNRRLPAPPPMPGPPAVAPPLLAVPASATRELFGEAPVLI